ncbi:MAG: 2-amino-4-hydroxy-6-hydroxymethyldihydropteridine diphosphokinase [Acidaminococcus sp.]|uniref:2-amino-4-hydroxy-6-hydroxymethyldihydropteridine diphosphokinase n=1 Tax=Acidaminococcus intestini TaxID=187327 RepID=A0A943EHT1_9FIRM|nr:2-amino-4-hydroxy-6-hydroxymethyldihydropteridine diphosphokinase [Acidaminococcus sp.]MBS5520093.1 2-amino-4-hydroxy-6-hydroxymethyldihydropteridine diphosphokinase [Acidaminococcus intestini]MDY2738280.1 2-amino-4-hydroxy-6-hydroxymethyldihydropteridine diphosphokinase [Acidaminococcus sp.]
MPLAYVALGSNLGDKKAYLEEALHRMNAHGINVQKVSTWIRTAPYGVTDQPEFLNGAAEVIWEQDAASLLKELLAIEKEMGRQRKRHWGERNIDLDLILFGNEVLETEFLTLPHPDMQNRDFVLRPLAEIAPQKEHPVLKRTMLELWHDLQEKAK